MTSPLGSVVSGPLERRVRIYLGDLNHGRDLTTVPFAIGYIAAYAKVHLGDSAEISLFKSSAKLTEAILAAPPDVLGFSNYIWNSYLCYEIARRARALHPDMVVVFGGPNYSDEPFRQREMLARHPVIDFNIRHEGEKAFLHLLRALDACGFSAADLKSSGLALPNCDYLRGDEMIAGENLHKTSDLTSLPSPYLMGLFDDFLRVGMDTVLQYRRGCPFTCTFCTEGLPFHTKIGKSSLERFRAELEHAATLADRDSTLYMADANFGMFKDDVDVCHVISEVQAAYKWPTRVHAPIGKNNKERVLQVGRVLNGALRLGIGLQSTDPTVLTNIKRSNISTDKLMDVARRAGDFGQTSFAELILSLPGETRESHENSIRDIVNAGISRVQMYPLNLLPGTEMDNQATRDKFGIHTKFRILPRCFSYVPFGSETLRVAEIVEMPISSDSMSFDDFLDCKELQLSVEFFYNDDYFMEVQGLLAYLGHSMMDFIMACHEAVPRLSHELQGLYQGLRKAVIEEHWDSCEALEAAVNQVGWLEDYTKTEYLNSLATLRAVALLSMAEPLHVVAEAALRDILVRSGKWEDWRDYCGELMRFSRLRKSGLLEYEGPIESEFSYDWNELVKKRFVGSPDEHRLSRPSTYVFRQEGDVTRLIRQRYSEEKDPIRGMRRVMYFSLVTRASDYFHTFEAAAPARL